MSEISLDVEVREDLGKGGARAARRNGLVPGVLYGGERGTVAISLKQDQIRKAYLGGQFLSQLMNINHKGESQPVIARDVQLHPLTDWPIHVDLFRVDEDTRIAVDVNVKFLNEELSPGLKRGGVLNIVRHDIEVYAPAGSIPEALEADLDGLEIGDSIHISDIKLPEGVMPTVADRDFTVATLVGARAAIEVDEEEETDIEGEVSDQEEDGTEEGQAAETTDDD